MANRHVPGEDVLDRVGADRAVEFRRAVPSASVVDTAVLLAAERAADAGGVVKVLTSDVGDLRALAGHSSADIDVVRL